MAIRHIATLALAWTLSGGLSAQAQATNSDQVDCANARLKATRVEACSRLIASHGARDGGLAALFDQRAAARAAQGDYSGAAEDLGQAMRLRPEAAAGFLVRGKALFRADRTDEALADFNRAVVLEPGNRDARLWRARTFRALTQYDNALNDVDVLLKAQPKDIDATILRGLIFDDQSRFGAALKDYEAVVQAVPRNVAAVYNRAWARFKTGDHGGALRDLATCQSLDQEDADCYALRAQVQNARGDLTAAGDSYAQAIARAPKSTRLLIAQADVKRRAGRFDDAIANLTAAYRLEPDLQTLYDRGWMQAVSGRPDNAIADYSIILRREGADAWPGALIERAYARLIQGDLTRAQSDLRTAQELQTDHTVRLALWRAALNVRSAQDSVWRFWRRYDAVAALTHQTTGAKIEGYEAPMIAALSGATPLRTAHRQALDAAKTEKESAEPICFVIAMSGAIALAEGDADAARTYWREAQSRPQDHSYACLIARAELNRLQQ